MKIVINLKIANKIIGFEALARWDHPDKGLIPPAEFLDVIEQAGMLERLAEVMEAIIDDKEGLL